MLSRSDLSAKEIGCGPNCIVRRSSAFRAGWTRTGRTRVKACGIRVARWPLSGPGSTAPGRKIAAVERRKANARRFGRTPKGVD
jgi:hypothetical protein